VCVTLSLLIIAKRMAKSRVLVKNLAVIETLSCVNVIASDKTGTLTQNKMFVASAAVGIQQIDLQEVANPEYQRCIAFNQLVSACGLCNNASFEEDEPVTTPIKQKKARGDATDIALLKFSSENQTFANLGTKYATIAEIPFNSRNKWMVKVIKPKDRQVHEQVRLEILKCIGRLELYL
jgi:sodium/potassium-transporting ATPase subunit alpha